MIFECQKSGPIGTEDEGEGGWANEEGKEKARGGRRKEEEEGARGKVGV